MTYRDRLKKALIVEPLDDKRQLIPGRDHRQQPELLAATVEPRAGRRHGNHAVHNGVVHR